MKNNQHLPLPEVGSQGSASQDEAILAWVEAGIDRLLEDLL